MLALPLLLLQDEAPSWRDWNHHHEFGREITVVADVDGDGLRDLRVTAGAEKEDPPDAFWILSSRDGRVLQSIPKSLIDLPDCGDWSDPTVPTIIGRRIAEIARVPVPSDGTLAWRSTALLDVFGGVLELRYVVSSSGVIAALAAKRTGTWIRADEVGDLDGDGTHDVQISGGRYEPHNEYTIAAFVSGVDARTLWSWREPRGSGRSVWTFVPLDDVDCDGVFDVALAHFEKRSRWCSAHVVSGRDGSVLRKLLDERVRFDNWLQLARLPDMDGDGVSDVAVTSYDNCVYGLSTTSGERLFADSRNPRLDDNAGFAWSVAGFVDAHRRAHILFGIENANGGAGRVECWDVLARRHVWSANDPRAYYTGNQILTLDDIDRDGTPDVCVDANHGGGGEPGVIAVLSGASGRRLWRATRSRVGLEIERDS